MCVCVCLGWGKLQQTLSRTVTAFGTKVHEKMSSITLPHACADGNMVFVEADDVIRRNFG